MSKTEETESGVLLDRFALLMGKDNREAVDLVRRVLEIDSTMLGKDTPTRPRALCLLKIAYTVLHVNLPSVQALDPNGIEIFDKLFPRRPDGLTPSSFQSGLRQLDIPHRAALFLFYTTQYGIKDIADILGCSDQECITIIAVGKSKWMEILQRIEGESP